MPKNSEIVLCTLANASHQFVKSLQWGLGQLGYEASISQGVVSSTALNILFHGFYLNPAALTGIAPRSVYFNLEQIGGKPRVLVGPQAFSMMRNLPTWDYSTENVSRLSRSGVTDLRRVPVGYAPPMEYIQPAEKDIDVLFYGSLNDRRVQVLNKLESVGLRTVWNRTGEYWLDETRDGLIARSKLVLNLAYDDSVHVFEEIRVSHLLANRVMVVSEISALTSMEGDLRGVIVGGLIDALPDICARYCADEDARDVAAAAGYAVLRGRDWLPALSSAIEHVEAQYPLSTQVNRCTVQAPRKINLGSGSQWRYDFINIDNRDTVGADIVHDMSLPIPAGTAWDSWRFGAIAPAPGFVDSILAEHVLEHVKDLAACMTTCLDWLTIGGEMDILVRYDLSSHAWSEPTAVRVFTEQSWAAFCDQCWSVGWRNFRFDLISQAHILSPHGQQLLANGLSADEVCRTPRAVDSLRVCLRKRALTDAEQAEHRYYFRDVS